MRVDSPRVTLEITALASRTSILDRILHRSNGINVRGGNYHLRDK